MAKKSYKGSRKRYAKKRFNRRRGYSKMSIKDFAYKMGLVSRGLKNPDSLVSESYNRGVTKAEKPSRKTLF